MAVKNNPNKHEIVQRNYSAIRVLEKYALDLQVEISEMSKEECEQLGRDMVAAGYKFSRTERRYESCVFAIFERAC